MQHPLHVQCYKCTHIHITKSHISSIVLYFTPRLACIEVIGEQRLMCTTVLQCQKVLLTHGDHAEATGYFTTAVNTSFSEKQANSSPLQKRTNGHCIYNKDKGAANKTHLSQGSAISTAIHLCGHTYVSSVFLGSCCKSHGINITILHVCCRQFFMHLVASLYLESLCTVASIFKYVWSQ